MNSNAEQAAYWNSRAGQRWAQWQPVIDRSMERLTAALMEFAAARPDERVVDIGCGCGSTSLLLAAQVGTAGQVLGVDISAPMLEVARRRAAEAGAAIQFVEADAALHPFAGEWDLLFSRFGLMFFADPVAALRNLRSAARRGGRLVFLCWRPLLQNQWAALPLAAARSHLPQSAPADPLAPGPFAFADAARIRELLTAAGFTRIAIEPLDAPFWMGDTLEAAVDQALTIGPLAAACAELDAAARGAIRAAVGAKLQPHLGPAGIELAAACWLVRAGVE